MSLEAIPVHSDAAKAAIDVLYSEIVPVHFFVEDEGQKNLYDIIFSRVFPRIGAFKVFPLSGKAGVIAHATASYAEMLGTKRVYVLDKDFDDLKGEMLELAGLFYLDEYCIENAILEEPALISLVIDEKPKMRIQDITREIDFRSTLKEWRPQLERLHRAFYVAQKFDLEIQNCSLPPERFTSQRSTWQFDATKILNYIDQVIMALINDGIIPDGDGYEDIAAECFPPQRGGTKHINGKFVLKLFLLKLKSRRLIGSVSHDSATIRLARYSKFRRISKFKRAVNGYLSRAS